MRFGSSVLVFAALALWLPCCSSGQAQESSGHHARVVGKVPVQETEAVFERIDLLTMSTASQAADHPLDLIVNVGGCDMQCRCSSSFYHRARVGDEITVKVRAIMGGGSHCSVLNDH